MKFNADVYVTSLQVQALKRCFVAEIESLQTARSSVEMHANKERLHFAVVAKDTTALRATLNTITKLLSVFEKGEKN